MVGEGISTHLQKEVTHLQQEMAKLQTDFSQWDKHLDGRFKELKDEFHSELKVELQGLFEQYLGKVIGSASTGQSPDIGKGILGGPPLGFPPKEAQPTSPRVDLGVPHWSGNMDPNLKTYKLECPRFDGKDFKG